MMHGQKNIKLCSITIDYYDYTFSRSKSLLINTTLDLKRAN